MGWALREIRASGTGAVTVERGALFGILAALALMAILALAYGPRDPVAPMPAVASDVALIELDLTL